ncbi:hypothetical protein ACFJYO_15490, partial [Enterococcus faecalis]
AEITDKAVNLMENVTEIKESKSVDEVNELLKDGWKLLSVNTYYPNHIIRTNDMEAAPLIYVLGK